MTSHHQQIAQALMGARHTGTVCARFPGQVPSSLDDAYAVQDEMIATAGEPIVGWKVARLPAAMAAQVGAPGIVGPIFTVSKAQGAKPVAMGVFDAGYAAAEAEYVLRIGRPGTGLGHGATVEEAANLIAALHIGIEIASSPIAGIVQLGPAAVASDLGINNGLVVGPEVQGWRREKVEDWSVSTTIDQIIVGSGSASAFPGGLVQSLLILIDALSARGHCLDAGQWVASGAVTGVHPIQPSQTMEAMFNGRHKVSFVASAMLGRMT